MAIEITAPITLDPVQITAPITIPQNIIDAGEGVQLIPGPDGADGNGWLSGAGAPGDGSGVDGDFYLDTAASAYYGPKAAGTWTGTGPTSIVGAAGADGADGATGADGAAGVDGADGNGWLSGAGAPGDGSGVDGDFYLDTAASAYYGPKAGGTWAGTGPTSIVGAAGADGADGATGADGAAGVDGADGNGWLSGAGAPGDGSGVDGDFYLDTAASAYYGPKAAGTWTGTGPTSIVGAAGADGADGATGADGAAGVDGADGNGWLSGAGAPGDGSGVDGDFYLDTAASAYYGPKVGGTWTGTGPTSIVGAAGADGADGATGADGAAGVDGADGNGWLSGAGAPGDGSGVDGDFYLDTAASAYYGPKAGGTWTGTGPTSIVGAAGADGADGATGADGAAGVDGADGNGWLSGAGAPGDGSGVDGDFYLDTAASAYYGPKAGGTWTGTGPTSIVGAAGADGADGATGADGAAGVDGADGNGWLSGAGAPGDGSGVDGDFYLDTAASAYYGPKAGGTWTGTGPTSIVGAAGADGADGATGADGAAGVDGADGNGWLSGAGAPGDGSGVDGDFYLDTAASAYYGPKAGGTWTGTGPTSIVGAAGADGADGATGADGAAGVDGADGNGWLSGAGAPGDGSGVDGDFYLDTAASAYYGPKAGGTWAGTGPTSIVGAAGADGADGATGADGAAGVDGADGNGWLSGAGAPGDGSGVDGDFYLDTAASAYYGPKAGGTWTGTGPTSIVGAAGADGVNAAWEHTFVIHNSAGVAAENVSAKKKAVGVTDIDAWYVTCYDGDGNVITTNQTIALEIRAKAWASGAWVDTVTGDKLATGTHPAYTAAAPSSLNAAPGFASFTDGHFIQVGVLSVTGTDIKTVEVCLSGS